MFVNNYMENDDFVVDKSLHLPSVKSGGLSIFIYGTTCKNNFIIDSNTIFDGN